MALKKQKNKTTTTTTKIKFTITNNKGNFELNYTDNGTTKTKQITVDDEIPTATSIQPYQTLWWKDNAYMQIAFRIAKGETNYYDLLIPQGSRTNYWVASHCVEIYPESCDF